MSASTTTKSTSSKRTSSAKKAKSSGRKTAAKSTKSTGRKTAAKTAAKKVASSAPVNAAAKRSKPGVVNVRRFAEHADAAHAATLVMRHGGRNEGRNPVATSNIADVVSALDAAKTTPEKVTGLTTPQLVKLARGERIAEKVAAEAAKRAREFSSDAFGRATTTNKIRGAKLLAILAVVAKPELAVRKTSSAKSATKSAPVKSATKSRKSSTGRKGGSK
jgi:hypothetical protein